MKRIPIATLSDKGIEPYAAERDRGALITRLQTMVSALQVADANFQRGLVAQGVFIVRDVIKCGELTLSVFEKADQETRERICKPFNTLSA